MFDFKMYAYSMQASSHKKNHHYVVMVNEGSEISNPLWRVIATCTGPTAQNDASRITDALNAQAGERGPDFFRTKVVENER